MGKFSRTKPKHWKINRPWYVFIACDDEHLLVDWDDAYDEAVGGRNITELEPQKLYALQNKDEAIWFLEDLSGKYPGIIRVRVFSSTNVTIWE